MINPQSSFIKINQYIGLFNIEINEAEKEIILEQLEPINDLLCSHPKNSIYIYESGGLFYSEALIKVEGKYGCSNSVGTNLKDSIINLIPKLIESMNSSNLFPRNKQLALEDTYEAVSK